jgi:hypothetical protein
MSLYELRVAVLPDWLGGRSRPYEIPLVPGGCADLTAAVPFVPDWARVRGSGCTLTHPAIVPPPAAAVAAAAATGLALGSLPSEIQDTLLAEEMLFAFMVRLHAHERLLIPRVSLTVLGACFERS